MFCSLPAESDPNHEWTALVAQRMETLVQTCIDTIMSNETDRISYWSELSTINDTALDQLMSLSRPHPDSVLRRLATLDGRVNGTQYTSWVTAAIVCQPWI